jgi:DNA-binding CsgD family transcriptional regulator
VVNEGKPEAASRTGTDDARSHSASDLGAELETLLRRLIELLTKASPMRAGDLPVVVDLEVAGVRYVVRVATQASAHIALSPREHEIAYMVGRGLPNKTIAANLGISSWTVSTHLRRMFAKFRVNSRAALVAKLLEEELVVQEHRAFPL